MESINQFVLYTGVDGDVKLKMFLEEETLWLSQKLIGELFQVEPNTINYHIKEIFKSSELEEIATTRKFRVVQTEGSRDVSRDVVFYNLDMIIAVGYRVNSKRATQFRIWATKVLKEYIIKGFALDDERLKQGERVFENDYFKELLERIRSIRASERRIYQQITDIFAECSIDYNPKSEATKEFYATVQNKFHYAITGKTAAEIIHSKANKDELHMGLLTWKNAPEGRVLTSDVKVAKNYLTESEIKRLERTISAFFDYIENIIENRETFTMEEFINSVVRFLEFNEYKILKDKGKISKTEADEKALNEYKEYNKTQLIQSDFDKHIKKYLNSRSN
ncbi:virulence RhuM family protein [Clostridium bowmanii]|uniref:virulence RhuM family protein n=1 Tax=Clostridium bowmanii TaxID=132925 RepID=UPI001C0E18A4|nr:virulence RhuM family protein [Clostridium bowmanii]MBU3191310.1 virulence RhuM family protein [Clostridium bowmanii]MCA1073426.1 virulence RhuM family protein [Clostridium bowmanii]